MTIEEKLKNYILSNHKSLRSFVNTSGIDLPYSTIDGMLKRGIRNASIDNVLKICKALDISADELGNEKIVPNSNMESHIMIPELTEMVKFVRNYPENYKDFTIDKIKLSQIEMDMFVDSLELSIGLIRKRRERENN